MTMKKKDYKVTGNWFHGDRKNGKITPVQLDMSVSEETSNMMDELKRIQDLLKEIQHGK